MGRLLRIEEVPIEFFNFNAMEEEFEEDIVNFLLDYADALGVRTLDYEQAKEWAGLIMIKFLENGYE